MVSSPIIVGMSFAITVKLINSFKEVEFQPYKTEFKEITIKKYNDIYTNKSSYTIIDQDSREYLINKDLLNKKISALYMDDTFFIQYHEHTPIITHISRVKKCNDNDKDYDTNNDIKN